MPVTKSYFMTVVVVLILVDETTGNSSLSKILGSHVYYEYLGDR